MQTLSGPGPRLRIGHLLVWILGCALGFAAYRELTPRGLMPPMPPRIRSLSVAYNLVMGVALGTLLTGVGVLAHRRGRGDMSYPLLPGHWLLLFGVAAALADGVAVIVFRALVVAWSQDDAFMSAYWLPYRFARNGPNLPGMFHQCVGWGLATVAALGFLGYLRRRLSWPWLAVFFTFFLAAGVLAAGAIVSTISAYGPSGWSGPLLWYRRAIHLYAGFIFVSASAIVVASACDLRDRTPTDGLHWTGALVWLMIALVQVTLYACLR
jgi:hypothetical protein